MDPVTMKKKLDSAYDGVRKHFFPDNDRKVCNCIMVANLVFYVDMHTKEGFCVVGRDALVALRNAQGELSDAIDTSDLRYVIRVGDTMGRMAL